MGKPRATLKRAKGLRTGEGVSALRAATGAATLGLPTHDALRLTRLVGAGLPISSWTRLQKATGLPQDALGRWVGIPPRTLSRRQKEGRLQPLESDRVLRAARLFEMAQELFEGDAALARAWLGTPLAALGGITPLALASSEVGSREVESIIGRLEHGIFT